MGIEAIRVAARALQQIDDKLREGDKCAICGKPKNGIIPAGLSKGEVSLCVCGGDYRTEPSESWNS